MHRLKKELYREISKISDKVEKKGGLSSADLDTLYKLTAICHRLNKMEDTRDSNDVPVQRNNIDIGMELEYAEKYFKEYKHSADPAFLDLAKDKLKHAKMIMEAMPEKVKNHAVMMSWHADLESKINKEGKPQR